jgi:hypothetical protein
MTGPWLPTLVILALFLLAAWAISRYDRLDDD